MKFNWQFAFTFLIVSALLPQAFAQTASFWIVGRVSSQPTEQIYGPTHYYVFNFTIAETSNSKLTLGEQLTVAVKVTLLATMPSVNEFYNFTGYINENLTSDIPPGVFIVEDVNAQAEPDYIALFRQVVAAISTVMSGIVNTIAQVIYIGTGYQVPQEIITIVLVGLLFTFLIKYYKVLGLLFVLVLAFLVVSGFFNLIQLTWT